MAPPRGRHLLVRGLAHPLRHGDARHAHCSAVARLQGALPAAARLVPVGQSARLRRRRASLRGAAGRGGADQARAPRHARAHREAARGGRRRRRGGALARRGGGARREAVARVERARARAAQHDRRRGRALGAASPRPHRAARVAGRAGPAGRRRDRLRVGVWRRCARADGASWRGGEARQPLLGEAARERRDDPLGGGGCGGGAPSLLGA
mmetsp:Transcript_22766/g.72820  ORF Transcript_22766/g.72820 Transcript_22766/m.72820 type:complete len:211 (-) Transcript_22766:8-640(-)